MNLQIRWATIPGRLLKCEECKINQKILDFDREHVFRRAGVKWERGNDDKIMAGARFSTEDTFPVQRAHRDRTYDGRSQERRFLSI